MQNSTYRSWLLEEERLEVVREAEEQEAMLSRHQAWLEREKQAKLEWDKRKLMEEQQKQAREQQEKQIQEEWHAMKQAEAQEKQKQEEQEQQKRDKQEALLRDALSELGQSSAQNPPVPSPEERTVDSRPGLQPCPFFEKTGCCRFGPRCSRNHRHVLLGRCLLLEHFYQPLGVRYTLDDEQNLDVGLEFDDAERARHFSSFYGDVLPELRLYGEVVQFKVCQNYEPHLRGNVYVQYATENEAARAFKNLNGRWYGGEQISARFVDVQRWSRAICGSFFRGNCPKGRNCNFLHVFVNPSGEFWRADRDLPSSAEPPRARWSSRRETGDWSAERWRSGRHSGEEGRRSRSVSRRAVDKESSRSRRSPSEDEGHRSTSVSSRLSDRESSRSRRSPERRSSSKRRGRTRTDYESTRTRRRNIGERSDRSGRYDRNSYDQNGGGLEKSHRTRTPDSDGSPGSVKRTRSRARERSRSAKQHRSRSKDRKRKSTKDKSPRSPHEHRARRHRRESSSPKTGQPKEQECDPDCHDEVADDAEAPKGNCLPMNDKNPTPSG